MNTFCFLCSDTYIQRSRQAKGKVICLQCELQRDLVKLIEKWDIFAIVPETDKNAAMLLGAKLDDHGGFAAMLKACHNAEDSNDAAVYLAVYWDGIGQWVL